MGLNEATVRRSWRLNERHYGALEGIDPLRAIRKFGIRPILDSQLRFNSAPPPLDPCDARFPGNQLRYSCIDRNELPLAESMEQALSAGIALLERNHRAGNCPWQAGSHRPHKHILRALIMLLDDLSVTQLIKLSIANGRLWYTNLTKNSIQSGIIMLIERSIISIAA